MLKNGKIGFLFGTFFGAILGSTGTILVMKKLKKIAEKEYNLAESEAVNEVREYYREKLERLTEIGQNIDYSKVKNDSVEAAKNDEKKAEKVVEKPVITNPKFLYQDRLAQEEKEAERKKKQFDYSQISKAKYTDLKEEYEREEPEIEEEDNNTITQITSEQFEDEIAFRKENLIYYEQSGIFAGYDDIPVNDTYDENYFGWDNIGKLGTQEASLDHKSSINEIYLRDKLHSVDFRIILNDVDDFYQMNKSGEESN